MSSDRFEFGYRPDNRWLHRRIDRARYTQLLGYLAVGVLLLGALVAAAWPHLEAVRLGYRVEQLRLERDRLEKDVQRYRLDLSELTDPRSVERIAREAHGLEPPAERVVLEVPAASDAGGPASGSGSSAEGASGDAASGGGASGSAASGRIPSGAAASGEGATGDAESGRAEPGRAEPGSAEESAPVSGRRDPGAPVQEPRSGSRNP